MATSARSELLRPFYPALDGLRAVAILSVFIHHYLYPFYRHSILDWGWMGVDLFFVLSGFLITGILYDTLEQPDYFRNFYIRRTLRIFPLFYGFWLILLVLTPVLHVAWTRSNWMLAAYLGNFLVARGRLHQISPPGAITFVFHGVVRHLRVGHLWSLCIEEQFYLAWPAVVWLVRSRKTLLRICLGTIVFLPMARGIYAYFLPTMVRAESLYFVTWSRIDTLLCGAVIALWLRGNTPPVKPLRKYLIPTAVVLPVVVVAGQYYLGDPDVPAIGDPFVCVIGFSLIAVAFSALLILALEPDTLLARTLQFRPLVYLGRISYGLYFYHYIAFDFFFNKRRTLASHHLIFLGPLAAFIFAVIIASLSFHFLEAPFLKLKSRLAPRKGAIDDPAAGRPNALSSLLDGPRVEIES